jgi:hypothetical protein
VGVTVVAACAAAACSSDGDGEGRTDADPCEVQEEQLLEVDEQSPLGFSPGEFASFAEGELTVPIQWGGDDRVASMTPESGQGVLHLDVVPTYPARYVRSVPANSELGGPCFTQVEVPVDIQLRTDGGALNERFSTTLSSATGTVSDVRYFTKALDGDFAATLTEGSISGHLFSIEFDANGLAGSFTGDYEHDGGLTCCVRFASWESANAP